MMQYRKLGNTDVEVSAVIFGAWAIGGWMWGPQDHDDAVAAIRTSLDAGVNTIDTAAIYGFGRSEDLIAEALEDVSREKVVLMTKFGLRWDHDGGGELRFDTRDLQGNPQKVHKYAAADSVMLECARSLKRLKTDYIDVYQIHWPDDSTPMDETFGAIDNLLQQGKIRAIGVSNYSVEQLEAANKIVPLASSQPPFSMILRDQEDSTIRWCREHNVGVVVYSPLQRGLLTGKFTPGHKFAENDHRKGNRLFQPENLRRINAFLDTIRPIAEAHNATLAQLVIQWTVRRDGITAALVGARNPRQAADNAAALDFTLSAEEIQQIDDRLAELKLE